MKPFEFAMDEAAYRRYWKTLQRCSDTNLHKSVEKQRLLLGCLFFGVLVVLSVVQHEPLMQFLITLPVGVAVYLLMAFWLLPRGLLHRQMTGMRKQGMTEDWFRQPHRVWTDEHYYYHQVGMQTATGIALSQLRFVRAVKGGGVVIVFAESEDYLGPELFGVQLTEAAFCEELRQLSRQARQSPIEQPQTLAADETQEEMEQTEFNPLQLQFTLSEEEALDLLCESTGLLLHTGAYWRTQWKSLLAMVLLAGLWCFLDIEIWLLGIFLALIVAWLLLYAFHPGVRRRRYQKLLKTERYTSMMGLQEIELTPEKVYVQRKTMRTSYRYEYLPQILNGEKGVYLLQKGSRGVVVIPNKAFRDEEHRQWFQQEYKRRVSESRAADPKP